MKPKIPCYYCRNDTNQDSVLWHMPGITDSYDLPIIAHIKHTEVFREALNISRSDPGEEVDVVLCMKPTHIMSRGSVWLVHLSI